MSHQLKNVIHKILDEFSGIGIIPSYELKLYELVKDLVLAVTVIGPQNIFKIF
ncbi:MAG: hypothetical protein K8R06_11640 [Methanosarcinales archaeon]|nr:hypothetical protein [Methanosarcinales archaeon]